jgi:hypothetical protein
MIRAYQVVIGTGDSLPPRIMVSITRVNKVLIDHEANTIDEAVMVISQAIRKDLED